MRSPVTRDSTEASSSPGECARRGVFLHPYHNWFLMAAHTERDIDEALGVTEEAFKLVKAQYGG
jgi:glutamate-1-semialdehyde 2,1-aminomutase